VKKAIWIGAGLLGLSAMAWYVNSQVRLIKRICVKAVGHSVKVLGLNGTTVQIKLRIHNMGELSIEVKKYKFKIEGNGTYIATAYSDIPVSITPHGTTDVSFDVVLNPKTLIKNLGTIVSGSSEWQNIEIGVNGGIVAQKSGLPFYVPVKYRFKIKDITEGKKGESPC
jgi:LEA14-like dessication related protein